MNARIITAVVLSLCATSAIATTYPTFQELDVDGDGTLTQTELEVVKQFDGEDSDFTDTDADDNGSIDMSEYQDWVDLETAAAKSDAPSGNEPVNN